MIVEWLLDLVEIVVGWVMGLFDGLEIPDAVSNPTGTFSTLVGQAAGMGVWVPWAVIAGAVVASLGVWLVGFIIKAVKQVLAHVPLFGGAG